MRIAASALLSLALLLGGRAEAQGIVAGLVQDQAGRPLADARVSVEKGALIARTGGDGRFRIDGVAIGKQEIEVRKIGFDPAVGEVTVVRDSAVVVSIQLVPAPQMLGEVVVAANVRNRVSGVVMNDLDTPVEGAVVELIGQRTRVVTQADGTFSFIDLDDGMYLMQVRKQGYGVASHSIRMVEGIERDFEIRLGFRRPNDRLTPELAAQVAQEGTRRQGMMGARAAIVGRDELERFKDTRLDAALLQSSGGFSLRETGGACVLIDGYDPASIATATRNPVQSRNAPRTIVSGGAIEGWLSFFKASEVEMVEIYPPYTENSRTLCGRFQPSSGCSCPPDPTGIVIWLR